MACAGDHQITIPLYEQFCHAAFSEKPAEPVSYQCVLSKNFARFLDVIWSNGIFRGLTKVNDKSVTQTDIVVFPCEDMNGKFTARRATIMFETGKSLLFRQYLGSK